MIIILYIYIIIMLQYECTTSYYPNSPVTGVLSAPMSIQNGKLVNVMYTIDNHIFY